MYLDKTTTNIDAEKGFILEESDSNRWEFIKTYINMPNRERFGTIIANNKRINKLI